MHCECFAARVVEHCSTSQIAGSYFDTFIAMKFAWDEQFRTKVGIGEGRCFWNRS
jgi:hypothetical protein